MTNRLPAPERRRQLLDVALSSFGETGFHETSMNDIAAAAGVTKPVLYQHFASKRELFDVMIAEVGQAWLSTVLEPLEQGATPEEQVFGAVHAHVRFFDTNRFGFRVLFSDITRGDPEYGAKLAELEAALATGIGGFITGPGITDEKRMMMAHAIVGMAEGSIRYRLDRSPDHDSVELAETLAELLWTGLRGVRPS